MNWVLGYYLNSLGFSVSNIHLNRFLLRTKKNSIITKAIVIPSTFHDSSNYTILAFKNSVISIILFLLQVLILHHLLMSSIQCLSPLTFTIFCPLGHCLCPGLVPVTHFLDQ